MARRHSLLVVLAVAGALLVAPGVASAGGCHPDPGIEMTASSDRSVAIAGCAFTPTVTYVDPGQTVRWVNRDIVPHTVTGAALSWGHQNHLDQGVAVSYAFEKEGVYPYFCALHPSMVGAVVVGDGMGSAAAAGAGVEAVDEAAPVSAVDPAPAETGAGTSPAVLALALAAAVAAVAVAARYALARRSGAPSAP